MSELSVCAVTVKALYDGSCGRCADWRGMLHSLGCALPPADSDAHESADESELRVGVGGASHFELGVVLSLLHALVPASAARAGSLASEDAGLKAEGSAEGGAAEAAATAHAPAVRPFPLPIDRPANAPVRPPVATLQTGPCWRPL